MNINKYGAVFLTKDELFEAIYSGKIKDFHNIYTDKESTEQFNQALKSNKDSFQAIKIYQDPNESIELFDEANQASWFMPEDKIHHNLIEMIYSMCQTQEQRDRVDLELHLFIQHGMIDLLFYLKYLVDTMRENNIVWGVGRGSSVASYVLFLLGVHKIDSLKYELDIHEFLKKGEDNGENL